MKKNLIWLIAAFILTALNVGAQKVSPTLTYTDKDGNPHDTLCIEDGQAPVDVTFHANPSDMGDLTPSYEWHFYKKDGTEGGNKELFIVPGANHTDLYDRIDIIPFDKLNSFFTKNLK